MSCYSDSCLNGKSSLVQEVKARFEHFVNVVGYKGRVNVDNDGNPEIVTNDRPGMAPSDLFGWLLLPCFLRWACGCLLMFCLVGVLE
jgi:hypothetical protein